MKVMNPELRNLDLKKLDNGFEIKTENPYLWSIKRLPFFGFIGFLLFALFLIWFGISILTSVGNLISSWEEGVFVYLIVGFVSLLPLLIGALILLVFIRQIFYTKIIDIVKLEKDSIKLKRKFRFITSSIGSIKTVKLEMIRVINFDKYKSALEFISDENRVIFFENMPSRMNNSIKNYLEKLLVSM